MKAFLLAAAAVITLSGTVFGQRAAIWENFPPDLRWDAGVNAGFSGITRPTGPEKDYQGTRTHVVPEYSARVVYAADEHWNINFDLGFRTWESYGTWKNPSTMGTSLKNTEVKFQLGKPAISESIQVNYVIPFYTKYRTYNKANLYFGAMLGMVTTVSDGSVGYSRYNAPPDSSYRYISSYNYGSGIGFSFGLQAGYTYYILRRWGINVEVSARYVDVGTEKVNGLNDDHNTHRYQLLFLPQTIGIRYRFH